MSEGLFAFWGLDDSEPKDQASDEQRVYRTAFEDVVSSVNANLQQAVTALPTDDHAALDAQRALVYEAYQVAASQLTSDPSTGQQSMQRVVAAAGKLSSQAVQNTEAAVAAQQQWAARETEFDEVVLRIAELEDAAHPKSATLRKLADAIRERVSNRQYREALQTFDQLAPKLATILQEHDGAAAANATEASGADSTPSGLATLEVRVAYQGTPVPRAMVRLSTGPTQQPDTTTDANGIAYFHDIEPGQYHVNAAKQAFVFQPAHVPSDSLAPGKTFTIHVTKAAQGQPPAPGYLYSGGGAPTKPMTPPTPGGTTPPPVPGGTTPTPGGTPPIDPGAPPPGHPTEPPPPPGLPGDIPPVGIATVEVHVHDENGAPVDKAMVRISTGPTSPPDGQTNSAGIAKFQLAPGEYHVNAAKLDVVWQPAHIAPGKLQPGATYPVTLNKPHYPKPDGDTSTLIVHVTWGYGEAVHAARVDIDGNPKFSAPTDSNGFARFENLPVGPHSVQATHVSQEYGTVSRSVTANVTKDKQVTKTIQLSQHANLFSIFVSIIWKSATNPLASFVNGAIVTITPANAPVAVTNASGGATFTHLPAGNYTVSAIIPETGQTITSTNVILNEDLEYRSVDVPMYASRDADPTNPNDNPTGELTVKVLREGSELEAIGATVSLSPAKVASQQVEAVIGARFPAVPAGEYMVSATFEESDGTTSTASSHITIDANVRKETGLMLSSTSASPGGTLLVRVYDPTSGSGLNGVLVSLNEFAGSEYTNAGGLATFHKLPPGEYTVTAHPEGYDAEDVTRRVTMEGDRSEIQIPLSAREAREQTGVIYVNVSTSDGKDLDFTYVSIHPEVHAPQMAGTGQVMFQNIPAGEYVVQANLDDKVARQQVVLEGTILSASANLVLG